MLVCAGPAATPKQRRAKSEILHQIYSALLAHPNIRLDAATHDALLAARGFPREEAAGRLYGRLPDRYREDIAGVMAKYFARELLLCIPGFFVNRRQCLSIGGPSGLLIPVRDQRGQVIALMIRPDKQIEGGPKYVWMSSRKHGGPGPGAPAHVPAGVTAPAPILRVTEGPLKADIATILSGVPTIGLAGVGSWRRCLPIAKSLGVEVARLAFDVDWRTKPAVARAMCDCAAARATAGHRVEVEVWDAADGKGVDDLFAAGKTPTILSGDEAAAVLRQAAEVAGVGQSPDGEPPKKSADDEEMKETQAQCLLRLAEPAELFHDGSGKTYATIPVEGHAETHPIRSVSFKRWLILGYFAERQGPPSSEALQATLGVLDARAQFEGPTQAVHTRVAGITNSADLAGSVYYLDLGNDQWESVQVAREGVQITRHPRVRFRRARGMGALPMPKRGGSIDDLRSFLNVATDDDWRLVVAWLTAALRPVGPYPILAMQGEQGSAKSTTARVLRRLIDPHASLLRCEPKEPRDLMIAATNSWVQALDNLSGLPTWLSDALCRIATGGGFATRTLYENDEETFFDAMRPILLNGIEDTGNRPDLLDRCLAIQLPSIPDEKRREEGPFWRDFEAAHPLILGALLEAVVGGLRALPDVRLGQLPRMADFARWGEAVGRGLGWGEGTFLKAYTSNRDAANEVALDASPIAQAVRDLVNGKSPWEGTATELLAELTAIVPESVAKSKDWPGTGRKTSGVLRRLVPALRRAGIDVDFDREAGGKRTRKIEITRRASSEGLGSSRPSQPSRETESGDVTSQSDEDLDQGDPRDGRGGRLGTVSTPTVPNRPPLPSHPLDIPKSHSGEDLGNGCMSVRDGRDGRDGFDPSPSISGPDEAEETTEWVA